MTSCFIKHSYNLVRFIVSACVEPTWTYMNLFPRWPCLNRSHFSLSLLCPSFGFNILRLYSPIHPHTHISMTHTHNHTITYCVIRFFSSFLPLSKKKHPLIKPWSLINCEFWLETLAESIFVYRLGPNFTTVGFNKF